MNLADSEALRFSHGLVIWTLIASVCAKTITIFYSPGPGSGMFFSFDVYVTVLAYAMLAFTQFKSVRSLHGSTEKAVAWCTTGLLVLSACASLYWTNAVRHLLIGSDWPFNPYWINEIAEKSHRIAPLVGFAGLYVLLAKRRHRGQCPIGLVYWIIAVVALCLNLAIELVFIDAWVEALVDRPVLLRAVYIGKCVFLWLSTAILFWRGSRRADSEATDFSQGNRLGYALRGITWFRVGIVANLIISAGAVIFSLGSEPHFDEWESFIDQLSIVSVLGNASYLCMLLGLASYLYGIGKSRAKGPGVVSMVLLLVTGGVMIAAITDLLDMRMHRPGDFERIKILIAVVPVAMYLFMVSLTVSFQRFAAGLGNESARKTASRVVSLVVCLFIWQLIGWYTQTRPEMDPKVIFLLLGSQGVLSIVLTVFFFVLLGKLTKSIKERIRE